MYVKSSKSATSGHLSPWSGPDRDSTVTMVRPILATRHGSQVSTTVSSNDVTDNYNFQPFLHSDNILTTFKRQTSI